MRMALCVRQTAAGQHLKQTGTKIDSKSIIPGDPNRRSVAGTGVCCAGIFISRSLGDKSNQRIKYLPRPETATPA